MTLNKCLQGLEVLVVIESGLLQERRLSQKQARCQEKPSGDTWSTTPQGVRLTPKSGLESVRSPDLKQGDASKSKVHGTLGERATKLDAGKNALSAPHVAGGHV